MITPSFDHERVYWDSGITVVAGIDEVGMGALAGPVVAAAVIFAPASVLRGTIRDSKQLSVGQRVQAVESIKQQALAWAVGEASVGEINQLNIRQASHLAMRRAVAALLVLPELLLIDGNPVQLHEVIPAVSIIKGDQRSYSIAAASILAKVYRDGLMSRLDTQYAGYGFSQHKGYGTSEHLLALQQQGPCREHRRSYAPVVACLPAA